MASVVFVDTITSSALLTPSVPKLYNTTSTPETPVSFASLIPSLSVSLNTKLPKLDVGVGVYKPKSTVVSTTPKGKLTTSDIIIGVPTIAVPRSVLSAVDVEGS